MTTRTFNALVVDDDSVARRTVGYALSQENFHCSYADNGEEALKRLHADEYDLVVTDLNMPNKHGHALAVDVLSGERPPVLIIHSAIDDPRLTKDLILKGVDDVVYKPTNYAAFAAKARAFVLRRHSTKNRFGVNVATCGCTGTQNQETSCSEVGGVGTKTIWSRLSIHEYERRLEGVQHLFPLSAAAYEVFQLASQEDTRCHQLSSIMLQDAALTADVLRLANSSCYTRNRPATMDINEAVMRIGFKKIGEIALALNALSVFRACTVPWFDAEIGQARSLAARIALDRIRDESIRVVPETGLSMCAFLHPLGRVLLGCAFQEEYKTLIRQTIESGERLCELESRVFPEKHFAALGRVLSQWNVPAEIWAPLNYLGKDYETISMLHEPLRSQVERIMLAIYIAVKAVDQKLPWEEEEAVPQELLRRHGISNLEKLIVQTKFGLK